jgi:hypothetical protein
VGGRDAKGDSFPLSRSGGIGPLGADEGQGHVDAFDLAEPLLLLGPLATQVQVPFDLSEPG